MWKLRCLTESVWCRHYRNPVEELKELLKRTGQVEKALSEAHLTADADVTHFELEREQSEYQSPKARRSHDTDFDTYDIPGRSPVRCKKSRNTSDLTSRLAPTQTKYKGGRQRLCTCDTRDTEHSQEGDVAVQIHL